MYYAGASNAQNKDSSNTSQPISSKGVWYMITVYSSCYFQIPLDIDASQEAEGDSAYKTYTMPGDEEGHSSEPYSEMSDIGIKFNGCMWVMNNYCGMVFNGRI